MKERERERGIERERCVTEIIKRKIERKKDT